MRIRCYRLDCNFLIILFITVFLNERHLVNVICNHSVLQSYPAIADCHYREKAGFLEFKWDAESIIHWTDSTFVGNLSNTVPVGVRFRKMKNSQILWPHCTPCWFSARFEDGLLNIHSQPQLVVGLIVAAWNSLRGGNVSPATGEMLRTPRPVPCCNSISVFIKKLLRKVLPLPIFLMLGFFSLLRLVGSF